ncbi:MAG: 16S rRNA (uracil(1498)-N(3))-methyltransferase [Clostridiaceae bacterium]|nr:16S rRNA (uracil(1498)-N(3))-methyltransferase [Clostridiaceae bacterium]
MPRFFIEQIVGAGQPSVRLSGPDAYHIATVLRMQSGDSLLVCDGARTDLDCRIEAVTPEGVELAVLSRTPNQTEPVYHVTLYQGLVKGDKFDQIIQKSVELGVSRVVPVACRRSIAVIQARDRDRKTARWQKIAAEAAKQCGRGMVPEVAPPVMFAGCVAQASAAALALIPWELERTRTLRAALGEDDDTVPKSISLIIGPEGGLTEDEVGLARAAGILPVTLGKRILRAETAGPAVLAMLLYRYHDF